MEKRFLMSEVPLQVIGGHLVAISSAVRGRDDEIRADAGKVR